MASVHNYQYVTDPLKFKGILWPHVDFYDKEIDIIYSVHDNDETVCVAGNMLGKDFTAAFIVLWFFLTRSPCRIVTTSVDAMQLEGVLWGEIRRFIQLAKYPLSHEQGGPLIINHLHLRKMNPRTKVVDGLSYCLGRVAKKGEGMLGHHVARPVPDDGIPRTLFVADEASGVDDVSYERAETWANRILVIGNPYECQNFFRRAVDGGDILAKT